MDKEDRELSRIYVDRLFTTANIVADGDWQLSYLQAVLPAPPGTRTLDAGCGNGCYALKLAQMGYTRVVGCDLHPEQLVPRSLDYTQASIEDLPFKDESFGVVYSLSVIYHLRDREAVLRELGRVLEPGGLLIVTSHTRYSIYTAVRRLRRALRAESAKHLADVEFPSAREIATAARRSGFRVTLVDGYSPGFRYGFRWWARRLGADREIQPPVVPSRGPFRAIRSEFAYHSVVVAEKLPRARARETL